MKLSVYREEIKKTFITDKDIALEYCFLKLIGELGEFLNSECNTYDQLLETGDLLYYIFQIENLLDINGDAHFIDVAMQDQIIENDYEKGLSSVVYTIFRHYEVLGKSLRKNSGYTKDFFKKYYDFAQEMYNVLYYYIERYTEYTLEDAMRENISKLTARLEKGEIKERKD